VNPGYLKNIKMLKFSQMGTIKMSSEKTETKMEEVYLSHYMTNALLQQ
jgi:hypothetical protein